MVQFMCMAGDRPVGVVTAYDQSIHGTCYVALLAAPEILETGLILEGAALFIEHLFAQWDLRQVYAETLAMPGAYLGSLGGRYWEIAGRLIEHSYVEGSYRDLLLLRLTRERWLRVRQRLVPVLGWEADAIGS